MKKIMILFLVLVGIGAFVAISSAESVKREKNDLVITNKSKVRIKNVFHPSVERGELTPKNAKKIYFGYVRNIKKEGKLSGKSYTLELSDHH